MVSIWTSHLYKRRVSLPSLLDLMLYTLKYNTLTIMHSCTYLPLSHPLTHAHAYTSMPYTPTFSPPSSCALPHTHTQSQRTRCLHTPLPLTPSPPQLPWKTTSPWVAMQPGKPCKLCGMWSRFEDLQHYYDIAMM